MAEKLVSMKIDKAEREKKYSETVAADGPSYPYGLSMHLDEDVLEKLDLDSLPKVDSTVMIYAKATVTSVSSNSFPGGEKRRTVGLQITHLCLEAGGGSSESAEKKLYDKG